MYFYFFNKTFLKIFAFYKMLLHHIMGGGMSSVFLTDLRKEILDLLQLQ